MNRSHRTLFEMPGLPVLQNKMYDTPEAARACVRGDVRLTEDLTTGLVANTAFRAELVVYDTDYQNEQGHSPAFNAHLNAVADLIGARMGEGRLVEIGCGKGRFLEMLAARGHDVIGVDPAYEGDNPLIRQQAFSSELPIAGAHVILRHVLEHVEDPVGFLHEIRDGMQGRGLIYIEVPCFDWICENRAWFDVFYEHVNYFRLTDFARMFGRIVHADRAFGGQYIRAICDLSSLRRPVYDPADAVTFPADFLSWSDAGQPIASADSPVIWGGASKGVIYSLLRAQAGSPVERVIDINPAKQGRFLPATGLAVMSPDDGLAGLPQGTPITVMNPNYLDEIREIGGDRFVYRGLSYG